MQVDIALKHTFIDKSHWGGFTFKFRYKYFVQGEAIATDLDLGVLQAVVEYWRTRCLATGTLKVMGLLEVKDLLFYLQYYLVPVATILGTPVVKLVVSLYQIYNFQPKFKS